MFCAQPRTELSKFINAYKSARSRLLKKEYPEIRKKHREPAEGLRLRSVTVSMEPSGNILQVCCMKDTAVKTKQLNQTIVLQRYLG